MAPSPEQFEQLPVQESVLATAMLHKIGNATIHLALQDGVKAPDNPGMDQEGFTALVEQFGQDPKESLAWARESLLAISIDERLDETEKADHLSRYLDSYFDLTIKLDEAAFDETERGEVKEGVPPGYIPDGFVDLGGHRELDPALRNREKIQVDKREVLEKYKHVLQDIFSQKFPEDVTLEQKKQIMVSWISRQVFRRMPYDMELGTEAKNLGQDTVKLSEVTETVCRHQALVFQVLCQAVGVESRLIKAYKTMDGKTEKHSMNMVRIQGQWSLIDTTSPDYVKEGDGAMKWRPGSFRVEGPPKPGERRKYEVVGKWSGVPRTYTAHDKMFWTVDRIPRNRPATPAAAA